MKRAREKLMSILDQSSFKEYWEDLHTCNFLDFDGYDEKLKQSKNCSKENETVITGIGKIHHKKCVFIVFEPLFMKGTMGLAAGEKISRAFAMACRKKLPVISISASGGVRLQEGTIALLQMAKTSSAVYRHSKKGLLYISVIENPTLGGVSASFASLADIIIGESSAIFGFTGKRIIEETIRDDLPDDFQTVEYARSHGMVDIVTKRDELRELLGYLLKVHDK